MNGSLIKILNPNVAKNLSALGFSFVKEQVNGKEVFCFPLSAELVGYMQKQYSSNDYFIDSKLHF